MCQYDTGGWGHFWVYGKTLFEKLKRYGQKGAYWLFIVPVSAFCPLIEASARSETGLDKRNSSIKSLGKINKMHKIKSAWSKLHLNWLERT